jgi:hypothetical protein
VAFYTDGKSVPGNADLEFVTGNAGLEFTYGGAVWRFSNVGNREVFADPTSTCPALWRS